MKPIILGLLMLFFGCPLAAQDTVPITIEDLRQFRKAAADAVFWENTAKDKDDQIASLQKSLTEWKSISKSETERADGVQGRRIDEVKAANTDLKVGVGKLETQGVADRQKIGDLTADNISLKSSRKYYGILGFVSGAAVGFFGGRQTCGTSIPGFSARADIFRPMPEQRRPTFNEFLKQYQR